MKKIIVVLLLIFISSFIFSEEKNSSKKVEIKKESNKKEAEAQDIAFEIIQQEPIQKYIPEWRFMASLYTFHIGSQKYFYNNYPNIIALEYRFKKNWGVSAGYYQNSFYNDAYVITLNKYFQPFDKLAPKFHFLIGLGFVKGYKKYDEIIVNGKPVVQSEHQNVIFGDIMYGGAVGAGYDFLDRLTVDFMFLGAAAVFMASIKFN